MQLGYVILYVSDVATTVEFYEKAFGLKRRFVHESGSYAEMETGGTALAFAGEGMAPKSGLKPTRPNEVPPAAEIALVTDKVQASYDRAIAAGAVAVSPPESKPWGQTVSYVRDANGFLVEICDPVQS